jgi:ketosteroid isomerase-like protein
MFRAGTIALAVAMAMTGTAYAQSGGTTPTDIINRHMAAIARSDVNVIMADYADDAVLLFDGKAIQGKAAIHDVIAAAFAPSAGAHTAAEIKTLKIWQEGSIGFTNWQRGSATGSDSFVIRNGKIAVQAVFMK